MAFVYKLLCIFFIFILLCFLIRFIIRLYCYIIDIKYGIKQATIVPIQTADSTSLSINNYAIEIQIKNPIIIDYGIYN